METQLTEAVAHKPGPDPVDIHVGRRMRERRMLLGLSQTELGKRLDVTFQQIQKYEKGSNRLSASMLWRAADALDVPISFFFDGLRDGQPPPQDPTPSPEEIAMIRSFRRLPERLRRPFVELASNIANEKG